VGHRLLWARIARVNQPAGRKLVEAIYAWTESSIDCLYFLANAEDIDTIDWQTSISAWLKFAAEYERSLKTGIQTPAAYRPRDPDPAGSGTFPEVQKLPGAISTRFLTAVSLKTAGRHVMPPG
jgi:hypothetical protein